jgi:PEP-CTERM motif
VTEGSFLSGGGATFFLPGFIDNTAGSVTFNANTLLSLIPGVSGNGTLLEFDFTALEAGTSSLHLAIVFLQDSNGNEIPSSLSGSSVNVSGTGSVPVPEPGVLTLFGVGLGSLAMLRAYKRT